ncbi:rhodanese-like domain-containing protein [Phaeovulum vinaykumarii]|uniref:Rhodanese-related sulfurtransferase n=1 Tax=Phaeovulum vinaykumarii TaxID=407234 RepID=A0A1N7LAQ7_9RHOB|nr:rhodanese-like domain-containing protein [Phaeovulum vinaykumarii]SIS70887.1 Rhodanese-related sulfurtransferase [Phaeovulum vinaykumarii]SOB98667.1 rhodanese-related sulfurtransferase [Phaeovulum vinaykumarii]
MSDLTLDLPELCPRSSFRALLGDALLVDVRDPHEIAALGFGDCDVLAIPMTEIARRWEEIPRDRPVIVACDTGARSRMVVEALMRQGFENVANMRHGLAKWVSKGLPVTGAAAAAVGESGCGCGGHDHAGGGCCGGHGHGHEHGGGCGCH